MARSTQKTTVYLDAEEYRRLKALARARKQKPAHLLREAVAEYTARQLPRKRARSIGAGNSRRGDLSERAEDLLAGFGRRR
jgi:predicted transcriptional regulator